MATTTETIRTGVMHEMDAGGDTQIRWNPDNEVEVDGARAHFDALRKKGYLPFKMRPGGDRGEQMTRFDANAERILMVPPSVGG